MQLTLLEVITLEDFYNHHKRNSTQAAKALGINRSTFNRYLHNQIPCVILPKGDQYLLLAQGRWS